MRGVALALFVLLSLPAVAAADPTNVDRARTLAQEAGDLIEAGKWADALARAKEAESLYHAPIHTFMMGRALEGLGRLAEAAAMYEQLVAEHLPPTAPQVFKEAQADGKQRLNALLSRVPSILVRAHGAPPESVRATIDGKPYDITAGVAQRLDPGDHEVKVTAGGFEPVTRTVSLPDRGGVVVVDVPLREPGASDEAPASPPTAGAAADTSASPPSRVPAIIAFGIGGAGIALGAVTGVMFLGKLGDLQDRCPNDRCAAAEQEEIDSTGLLGNLSTIGFGVGAAGVAAGVVLLVVSKPSAPASARTVRPWLGAGSVGVRGAF